jgi:hypothetical protein
MVSSGWGRGLTCPRIGPFLMLFIGLATLNQHPDLLQGPKHGDFTMKMWGFTD